MIKKELPHELKQSTAHRVKKMQAEFARPPILKVFKNEGYDQIIGQVSIPITALCEHHEVAFSGEVHIGYIPDEWLVGLSKLARVAEYYLNPVRKTLQERATHQILNHLKKHLKPRGIMVVIKATHTCITYRGVKKPSLTITSAVDGFFADPTKGARQEFLQLVNHHG